MTTLILHAPYGKARLGAKSFSAVLSTGIGDGYIITPRQLAILRSASDVRVVVLDKNKGQRAEGLLVNLVMTTKTPRGKQRYDVYIRDLRPVGYSPETLNRYGVAVVHGGVTYR